MFFFLFILVLSALVFYFVFFKRNDQPQSVSGKLVLVTGGGGGIGGEIAYQLACAHAIVCICDLSDVGMERTKNGIEKKGQVCQIYKADITSKEQVNDMVEKIEKKNGRLIFSESQFFSIKQHTGILTYS